MNLQKLDDSIFSQILERYKSDYGDLDMWRRHISDYFTNHPKAMPHVHSVKSRQKDPDHLRDKINRKWNPADPITADNLHKMVTDLAGVRILLLNQKKFEDVKKLFDFRLDRGEWTLVEPPKAYTWDPEAKKFFEGLGYHAEEKESSYTSVHYVIRQYPDSPFACEVQIRTLFEEIWGEVDHKINYPEKTSSVACRDQIMVLAKLIGAGSRLVDSIFSTHTGHDNDTAKK